MSVFQCPPRNPLKTAEATPTKSSPQSHSNTVILSEASHSDAQSKDPCILLAATLALSRTRLPLEAHGYEAEENLEHMLWEQSRWLDTYFKLATPPTRTQKAAQ